MGTGSRMHVLLATDGSQHARTAEELVSTMKWDGSRITAIQVQGLMPGIRSLPDELHPGLYDDECRRIDEHLASLATMLSRPGREVSVRLMQGRPATEIVNEARRIDADLVVVGSRGRGAIAATILGSVAAEVVDHAPCPVLVARRPRVGSVVLAHDGSDGARQAEAVLASWPPLRDLPIRVVSVCDVAPLPGGRSTGPWIGDAGTYQAIFDDLCGLHQGYAQEAAGRLGARAAGEARRGSVAKEIVDAAADAKADLIVIGSRGQTGLARLLLGSVARGVLYRSPVSVLVVRERPSGAARMPGPAPESAA